MLRRESRPQLIVLALMGAVGLHNMVRPGENVAFAFHTVDLVTNLLGYLGFSLFGSFAAYLGGSVVQVAFPFSLFTFLLASGRVFVSSLALFWVAHSIVDVSLYVRDARQMTFTLGGGGEHIWSRLLSEMGLLELDRVMGNLLHTGGFVMLLASLGVGVFAVRSAR